MIPEILSFTLNLPVGFIAYRAHVRGCIFDASSHVRGLCYNQLCVPNARIGKHPPTDTPVILLRPEKPMQEENRAPNGLFILGTEDLM